LAPDLADLRRDVRPLYGGRAMAAELSIAIGLPSDEGLN